eukprot:scaffold80661_cov63-Phaeocystis_antarctica.AAC.1
MHGVAGVLLQCALAACCCGCAPPPTYGRGVRARPPLLAQLVLDLGQLHDVGQPERGPLRRHGQRLELLGHVGLRDHLHADRGGRAALEVVDALAVVEEALQRGARPDGRAALAREVDPVGEAAVGRAVLGGGAREGEHAGDHVEGEAHLAVDGLLVRHDGAAVRLDPLRHVVPHL